MYAPNLTLLLASYSDAELDQAIRHGVPKDGRELWFMPSETYSALERHRFRGADRLSAHAQAGGQAAAADPQGPGTTRSTSPRAIYTDAPGMVKRYQAAPPVDLGPSSMRSAATSR